MSQHPVEEKERHKKKRKSHSKGSSSTKSSSSKLSSPRYLCSWEGLDEQRQTLRDCAVEIRDSDAALRALTTSVQATGHILLAIRDPSQAATPEVNINFQARLLLRTTVILLDVGCPGRPGSA